MTSYTTCWDTIDSPFRSKLNGANHDVQKNIRLQERASREEWAVIEACAKDLQDMIYLRKRRFDQILPRDAAHQRHNQTRQNQPKLRDVKEVAVRNG